MDAAETGTSAQDRRRFYVCDGASIGRPSAQRIRFLLGLRNHVDELIRALDLQSALGTPLSSESEMELQRAIEGLRKLYS